MTVDDNGNEGQYNGAPLPWSETVPLQGIFPIVVASAQNSDGSDTASITVTITVPGGTPVTQTSTGAYAIATASYS